MRNSRMAIVLALLCALTYGAGDFMGGLGSRRVHPWVAVFLVQLSGFIPALIVAIVVGAKHFTAGHALWALSGGTVGSCGLVAFYYAMSHAPMTMVAPVTALVAAAVPVVFGVVDGDRPSMGQWIGIVLALAAIVTISRSGSDASGSETKDGEPSALRFGPRSLLASIGGGFGFGFFFIGLDRAGHDSGWWPLAFGKLGGTLLIGTLVIFFRRQISGTVSFRTFRPVLPMLIAAGVLDVSANGFFLAADRLGQLAIVSVLSSLYPASTVILANRILKERISPPQFMGMGIAVIATVLVAAG